MPKTLPGFERFNNPEYSEPIKTLPGFEKFNKGYNPEGFQPVGDIGNIGESRYDDSIDISAVNRIRSDITDLEDFRAEQQSVGNRLVSGLPRLVSKTATEVAKMPGYLGGLAAFGLSGDYSVENFTNSINNDWVNYLDGLHEDVKKIFEINTPKSVREGNIWDNIGSSSFWMDEGIDGAGFLLAALTPGFAMKLLSTGVKGVGQATKFGVGASKMLTGSANLAKDIDLGTLVAVQTLYESASEAQNLAQTLKQDPDMLRRVQSGEITQEEADHIIGERVRNSFLSNMAILVGPNTIMSKAVFGRFKNSQNLINKATSELGLTRKKLLTDRLLNTGKVALSEGFWEEGSQFAIENYNKNVALGNTDPGFIEGFIDSYVEGLGTTEGQKSILLGGVFGSLSGIGYGKKRKAEYAEAQALDKKLGANTQIFSTNLMDRYKKDKDGKIIVVNGEPQLDETKVSNIIISKLKSDIRQEIKEAYAESGNEEGYNYASHKDFVDFAMSYLPYAGGLERLSKDIDIIGDNLAKNSQGEISPTLKEELKEKAKLLQSIYDKANVYGPEFTDLEYDEQNREAAINFSNSIKFTLINEAADQYYLKGRIDKLSNELDQIKDSNLAVDKKRVKQISKQIEIFQNELNDSNKAYDNLLKASTRQKAFDSYLEVIGKATKETVDKIVQDKVDNAKTPEDINKIKKDFEKASDEVKQVVKEKIEKKAEEVGLRATANFTQERNKILAEERRKYDPVIEAKQKELGLSSTPDINIPESVEHTLEDIDNDIPVLNERLKEASDVLYKEYQRLEMLKTTHNSLYTVEQLEVMQEVLGEEITNLNNLINEQAKTGKFKIQKIKLTDETEVSQITQIREREIFERDKSEEIKQPIQKEESAVQETTPLIVNEQVATDEQVQETTEHTEVSNEGDLVGHNAAWFDQLSDRIDSNSNITDEDKGLFKIFMRSKDFDVATQRYYNSMLSAKDLSLSLQALKDTIDSFVSSKKDIKAAKEVVENIEERMYIPESNKEQRGKDFIPLEIFKDHRDDPQAALVFSYKMSKGKVWEVVLDHKGDPIPNGYKEVYNKEKKTYSIEREKERIIDLVKSVKIDIQNSPDSLKYGSEIEFIIDLNEPDDAFHTELRKLGKETFRKSAKIYVVQNGKRLTVLQSEKNSFDQSESLEKLKSIRNELWSLVDAGKPPIVKGYIVEKGNGKIFNTSQSTSDFESVLTRNSYKSDKAESVKDPLVFGIAKQVGTEISIIVPNPPKHPDFNYDVSFTGNYTPGHVFLMVPSSNGNIIPVRVLTKKFSEMSDLSEQILKEFDNFKNSLSKEEIKEIYNRIGKLGFFDFNYNKEANNFTFYERKKAGVKTPVVIGRNEVEKYLQDKIVQVDATKINTGNYNSEVAAKRVTTDLKSGQYTHSPYIRIDRKVDTSKIKIVPEEKEEVSQISDKVVIEPKDITQVSAKGVDEGVKSPVTEDKVNPDNALDITLGKGKTKFKMAPIKSGVTELFESNPELSDIGTKEEYSQYLDTIFPDSKVKDIVYHGTNVKFDKFDLSFEGSNEKGGRGKGLNFTRDLEGTNLYGDIKIRVLLNAQNRVQTDKEAKQDNLSYIDDVDELVVYNPEQIHILGSKQDIENFKKFINSSIKRRESVTAETTEKITEWELNFMKETLPQIPHHILENLRAIDEKGGDKAWGAFKNATIYLAKNAGRGTAYHEAGHAVFNLFLTPSQREAVLNDASKKFGVENTKELEEKVMDAYMDYMITQVEDASLGKNIINFFKDLWIVVKYFFTGNMNMDVFFYKMKKGIYKNYTVPDTFQDNAVKFRIPDLGSYEQQQRRISEVVNIFYGVVEYYRNTPEYKYNTQSEIMRSLGVSEIIGGTENKSVLATLYSLRKQVSDSPESYATYTNMINQLVLGYTENNKPVLGPLAKALLDSLNRRGIKINIRGSKIIINEVSLNESTEAGELLYELNENINQKEGWQIEVFAESAKERLAAEVRNELNIIPLRDKNGEVITDDLTRLPVFMDPDVAFNTLLVELRGNFTSEKMMNKFEDIIKRKPYFKGLLDKLKQFDDLRTKFFVNFAKIHSKFLVTIERNGQYWTVEANKGETKNLIFSEWKNNFENPAISKVVNNSGGIIQEEAIKISNDLNNHLKGVTHKITKHTPITLKETKELSDILNKVGITISPEELFSIYNVEEKLDDALNNYKNFIIKDLSPIFEAIKLGRNPYEGSVNEVNRIMDITSLLSKFKEEIYESSHTSVKNTTYYAHQNPGFIDELFTELTGENRLDLIKKYQQDFWYADNLFLKEFEESQFAKKFGWYFIDGLNDTSKRDGISYTDMSSYDLSKYAINSFYNGGRKDGFFKMQVFGDSPRSLMIKTKKYSLDECVEGLFTVAKQEYKRIQVVKERKKLDNYEQIKIDNFDKNGEKYCFLPYLNNLEVNPINDPEAIKGIIREHLENSYREYLDRLVANRMIEGWSISDKGEVIIQRKNSDITSIDSRIDDIASMLKEFIYNDTFIRSQIIQLTSKDLAFYKSMDDYVKRAKEGISPVTKLDTEASFIDKKSGKTFKTGSTYTVAYLNDPKTKSKLIDDIKEILIAKGVSEVEATKTINSVFTNMKTADSQAWIHPDWYRKQQIGLSRWNSTMQDALERIKVGIVSDLDASLFVKKTLISGITPVKPFHYEHTFPTSQNMIIPTQDKNSEYMLTPQLAYFSKDKEIKFPTSEDIANNFEDYISPFLARMYYIMDTKTVKKGDENISIDCFMMTSAHKVGNYGSADNMEDCVVHMYNVAKHGLIQETPEHHLDAYSLIGTQFNRLLWVDSKNIPELIPSFNLWQEIRSTNIEEDSLKVNRKFAKPKDFIGILMEQADNKRMDEQTKLAYSLDADGELVIPLGHPLLSSENQRIVSSLLSKSVIKQKIPGGNLIQVSGMGLEDSLQVVLDKESGAIDYVEVLLPCWFEEFYPSILDENGVPDIEKLPEELRTGIFYRIPTEGKYSCFRYKAVGFSPSGSSMLVPGEILAISNSDCDADKNYIFFKKFDIRTHFDKLINKLDLKDKIDKRVLIDLVFNKKKSENKDQEDILNRVKSVISKFQEIELIEYDESKSAFENTREARDNKLIEIAESVLKHPSNFKATVEGGGAKILATLAEKMRKTYEIDKKLDPLSPSTQIDHHERTIAGLSLIAPAALHNVNHAFTQYLDLRAKIGAAFSNKSGKMIYKNELNQINDINNNLISGNIAMVVGSAVDMVKDPFAIDINLNPYTVDLYAYLMRLGHDPEVITMFINQPILREFTSRYFNRGATKGAVKEVYKELLKEYQNDLEDTETQEESKYSIKGFYYKDLVDSINNRKNRTQKFLKYQIDVLNTFMKHKETATSLSDFTRATRDDVSSFSDMVEAEIFFELKDKVSQDQNLVGDVDAVYGSDKYPMLKAAYEANKRAYNKMKKIFPDSNDAFMEAKKIIKNNMTNKILSKEDRRLVINSFITYLASDFSYFKSIDYDYIINKFPSDFKKLFDADETFRDNFFIRNLNYRVADKQISIDRVEFLNKRRSPSEKERIKQAWHDLMVSDKYHEVASNLIKYMFTVSGFSFTQNSFAHLVPTQFYIDLLGPEGSFNTFLDRVYKETDFSTKRTLEVKTAEPEIKSTEQVITGFQGYKGGFENVGKGTTEGDGKDKAMRNIADGFIGEIVKSDSSSMTSFNELRDSENKSFVQGTNSSIKNSQVIMLARNSEYKGKELLQSTKDKINTAFNNGAEFIVGDMPNVDSQFIDYLQEIGAKFTIYHTGSESRIKVEESKQPIVEDKVTETYVEQDKVDIRNHYNQLYEDFVSLFFRNYAHKWFVPSITKDNITEIVKNDKGINLKVVIDINTVKDDKLALDLPLYIKDKGKSGIMLYEYSKDESDVEQGIYIYNRIETLGYPNYTTEFIKGNTGLKSVIKDNHLKDNPLKYEVEINKSKLENQKDTYKLMCLR